MFYNSNNKEIKQYGQYSKRNNRNNTSNRFCNSINNGTCCSNNSQRNFNPQEDRIPIFHIHDNIKSNSFYDIQDCMENSEFFIGLQ